MRFIALFLIIIVASCTNSNKKENNDFITDGAQDVLVPDFPDTPRWVEDSEKILSQAEKDSINAICEEIFSKSGHFPMILTTGNYDPYNNLNDFTAAIDKAWAEKSQKYFIIIVSRHLEEVRFVHGQKTELLIHSDFIDNIMQNEMFPEFRNDRFADGIILALNRYRNILIRNK